MGPATSGRTRWLAMTLRPLLRRQSGLPAQAPASIFASMKPEPAPAPAPGQVEAPTM
jgi:hypothetical protein